MNRAVDSIEVNASRILSRIIVVCPVPRELPSVPPRLLIFDDPLDAMPVPHTLAAVLES